MSFGTQQGSSLQPGSPMLNFGQGGSPLAGVLSQLGSGQGIPGLASAIQSRMGSMGHLTPARFGFSSSMPTPGANVTALGPVRPTIPPPGAQRGPILNPDSSPGLGYPTTYGPDGNRYISPDIQPIDLGRATLAQAVSDKYPGANRGPWAKEQYGSSPRDLSGGLGNANDPYIQLSNGDIMTLSQLEKQYKLVNSEYNPDPVSWDDPMGPGGVSTRNGTGRYEFATNADWQAAQDDPNRGIERQYMMTFL